MKRTFTWFFAVVFAVTLAVLPRPAAAATRDYTRTQYPIVLVPGVSGFRAMFGVVEYFLGIPSALEESGARVYTIELTALASAEERGEDLLRQLRYISAVSGAPKLNVIGHSQGGLDARYAFAARPDLFASLTTVASPHKGAPLADFLRDNLKDGSFGRAVGVVLGDSVGFILNLLSGSVRPQDSEGALESLSSAGAASFNARYPAGVPTSACGQGAASHRGVPLYSWTGITAFTNPLDTTDYAFGLASLVAGEKNDGLVEQCSSHFGTVLRDDYRMNHGDEINQLFGFANVFEASPVSTFRTHVNRLKLAGL